MKNKSKFIAAVSAFALLLLFTIVSLRVQQSKYDTLQKEYYSLYRKFSDVRIENINLEKEIESLKNNATNLFSEATILQNKGLFDKSVEKYNQVIEQYPTSEEAKLVPERVKEIENQIANNKVN